VVVQVGQSLDTMTQINEICHKNKVCFVGADIKGVFSYVFDDFGENFEVTDSNGEPPQSLVVTSVSQVTLFNLD
jgi:ubiquitin-activating enzyme E1